MPSGTHHAVMALHVGAKLEVVVAVFLEQGEDGLALGGVDFEEEPSPWGEQALTEHRCPFIIAERIVIGDEEREARLEVGHVCVHLGAFMRGDVGRVAGDDLESGREGDILEDVGGDDLHARRMHLDVPPCECEGVWTKFEGVNLRLGESAGEGDGDAAAAAAQVENAGRGGEGKLGHPSHKLLSLRPWDEHAGPDGDGQVIKPGYTRDILKGLHGLEADEGCAPLLVFLFRKSVGRIHQNLRPGAVCNVYDQVTDEIFTFSAGIFWKKGREC